MSDEAYVIDLCDKVLGARTLGQHRFAFLTGDSGVCLPCDAYYPEPKFVVEYRERQHGEAVKFFDRRVTVSGMHRGEQRKLQRRREVLPREGIKLLELDYSMFTHDGRRRLKRLADDERIIRARLKAAGVPRLGQG